MIPARISHLLLFALSCTLLPLAGCMYSPLAAHYKGPPQRPAELEQYYAKGSYSDFTEKVTRVDQDFSVRRLQINTSGGLITIDYYQRPKQSENLIFVFPLLGGKNIVADHFADYFAHRGYDTAIVHRVNDFKDPKNFDKLEEIMRQGIVRDRIALDFFEQQYGKKKFGSFGISRGAINVAMTAGVDPRLKYNVMAMGGTDIVRILKKSDQPGIKKYRDRVMAEEHITSDEFYTRLKDQIRTDPKQLASYVNARNALLFFGIFDKTVPFKYGRKLRKQIGQPRTIYLLAGHYTSVLYTQFVRLVPPVQNSFYPSFAAFPMDYVERESLAFYDARFKHRRFNPMIALYRALQFPVNVVGWALGI